MRRRWRAASTRARCVSHASLFSFSRKKTYARKTTMPRRPRTRGRIFDARARLCAAKIHAPNINQRCPTPWIQLTCLVGTVTVCRATKDDKKHPSSATLDARRFFFASARSFFSRTTLPRTAKTISTSRASQVVRQIDHGAIRVADRDSPCPCAVSFYALLSSRACLPRCWVAERSAVTRSVQVLRSERAFCHAHRSRSQRVAMTGRRRGCFYMLTFAT